MMVRNCRWMLVCALVGMVGCSLFWSDPEKMTIDSDYNQTFDRVRAVLASNRFPIEEASREKGKIKTGWKEYPSDVKTKRKRFFAEVKKPEGESDTVRVTLRSEVQEVESGMKTYRTEQAEWDSIARDRELEKDLLKMVRFNLKSEEMEKKALDEIERRHQREKELEELKKKEKQLEE